MCEREVRWGEIFEMGMKIAYLTGMYYRCVLYVLLILAEAQKEIISQTY